MNWSGLVGLFSGLKGGLVPSHPVGAVISILGSFIYGA